MAEGLIAIVSIVVFRALGRFLCWRLSRRNLHFRTTGSGREGMNCCWREDLEAGAWLAGGGGRSMVRPEQGCWGDGR